MEYAKGLLSRAKELAVQTAQEIQARAANASLVAAGMPVDAAPGSRGASPGVDSPSGGSRDVSGGRSISGAGASSSGRLGPGPGASTSMTGGIQSEDVRLARFQAELRGSTINLHALKRLAFHGIPDKGNLRATVWKLLLGYLPLAPEDWARHCAARRTQYHVFCDELIVDPKRQPDPISFGGLGALRVGDGGGSGGGPEPAGAAAAESPLEASSSGAGAGAGGSSLGPLALATEGSGGVPVDDHPLSLAQTSRWCTYFKDSEVMVQVERDVMRTHPDMHFFTGDSPEAEAHREDMKRALFMYAKLNPGLRYIQGMNELIAPLYYLFKTDTQDPLSSQYAEADAFWCFMELISDFRDHFCAQLDNAQSGIKATIRRLMLVLQHYDKELWHHMEVVHKVDPQFYAFRWMTLLLSQEFAFPDTLRIWDTILSDPHGRMDCLMRICTAMILHVRPILMRGDFSVILKTLQRYPPVDVNVLLTKAAAMPPCTEILAASV
ncbi:hypothetical protein HYH02_012628 [Chlamydomonas schloesseri]|uniref:Rab-GAP TBC domain-containing protein n=1 Tax=Chlamydomonas schloesseri TaxID=2026947 RepID=A0A835VZD5_9CHLO|nr:hypothetical protein HYH02_012628 [Chlamydomonas schloesseri]|eukprot:KAG2433510.1 hypothetical protein HYH02_012628 [Chlamydomonas schloesseri]